MKIGEIAASADVSIDTVRFYSGAACCLRPSAPTPGTAPIPQRPSTASGSPAAFSRSGSRSTR